MLSSSASSFRTVGDAEFSSLVGSTWGASMPNWNLEPIERAVADAALNPASWVKALDTATARSDSFGAILLPIKGGLIQNVPFTEPMNEATDTYFRDHWYLRDERYLVTNIMMQRGV